METVIEVFPSKPQGTELSRTFPQVNFLCAYLKITKNDQ